MATIYTRLILVRHGETEANREQRYIGRFPATLTEAGQAQARQLAEALARLPADWHPSLPRVRLLNGHASWGLHPDMFIGV